MLQRVSIKRGYTVRVLCVYVDVAYLMVLTLEAPAESISNELTDCLLIKWFAIERQT